MMYTAHLEKGRRRLKPTVEADSKDEAMALAEAYALHCGFKVASVVPAYASLVRSDLGEVCLLTDPFDGGYEPLSQLAR